MTQRTSSDLREILSISAPTVATMTSFTVMQFVDKWMVSLIGEDPVYVGAQGNGGLAAFVPISIAMGFLQIINTFVAQHLGAGRPERAPAYAWAGIWFSLVAGAAMVPLALGARGLFELLGHEGRRLELESGYARILLLGAGPTLAARALGQYYFGMHRPRVVLAATLAGNSTNILFNWILIYGNLGAPALGVRGAAISTVLGACVELLIPLALFLSAREHLAHATRKAWRPPAGVFKDVLRLGWPGALMFGNEMICWALFMVDLVGRFGPRHSTAGWIAHQYMALSFMPTVGISVAVTSLVGKSMGAGDPAQADRRARLGLKLALAWTGLCAIVFVAFRHELIGVFVNADASAEDRAFLVGLGAKFLIATACFQLFDGLQMTLAGALRGAGDTLWPGVATLLLSWTIIVGGGNWVVAWRPQWESVGPWAAAGTYILVLFAALLWRYARGPWRRIRLSSVHGAG